MTNLYNLIIIIGTNEMNFKFSCKYTKAWEAGQIRAKVIPKGHASREKTMPWYSSTKQAYTPTNFHFRVWIYLDLKITFHSPYNKKQSLGISQADLKFWC